MCPRAAGSSPLSGGSSWRRARCGWLRPCRAFRAVRWLWRAPAPRRPLLAALGGGIHALGALPHEQIVQLLTQADAYCLPTEYAEGFPTTLLEAAACRCPIVTTRTAGTDELLPGGRLRGVFGKRRARRPSAQGWKRCWRTPAAARTRAEKRPPKPLQPLYMAGCLCYNDGSRNVCRAELRCQNYSSSSPRTTRKPTSCRSSRS